MTEVTITQVFGVPSGYHQSLISSAVRRSRKPRSDNQSVAVRMSQDLGSVVALPTTQCKLQTNIQSVQHHFVFYKYAHKKHFQAKPVLLILENGNFDFYKLCCFKVPVIKAG